MTDTEETPILQSVDTTTKTSITACEQAMVLLSLIGYYFTIGMSIYLTPEYTHYRVDDQYSTQHGDEVQLNYTYSACHENNSGPGYERYTHVQQNTAKWQMYFTFARVIPSTITTLIWASFSDVIGRKTLLVLSISGYLLKQVVYTLVIYFKAHLGFLLIGEFADGLFGTFTTLLAVLFSMVADITDIGRKRTIVIVFVELVLGLVVTISSFANGYYIKYTGYFYPTLTGIGLVFISLVVVVGFVPDTLRKKKSGGCANLLGSVSEAFKLYFKQDSKLIQLKNCLLITAFIFYTLQLMNRGNLEAVYQLREPFCWDSTKIGWFGAGKLATGSVIGMGGVFIFKRIFADDTIAVLSCALTSASYVVEGLARTETVLYTVPALATLSVLPVPMIRSLMSQLTPPEKQGALFSTIGAVEALCSLLGSLTGNLVYAATLSIMNGFVFLVLAGITAVSGAVLVVFMCVQRCDTEADMADITEIRVKDQQPNISSKSASQTYC